MTTQTIGLSQQPKPLSRMADYMVLGLLIFALVAGYFLRQSNLFAVRDVTVGGLTFAVPRDSVMVSNDPFELATPDGLTVRVVTEPAPATDIADLGALTGSRALKQSSRLAMYQALDADTAEIAGQPVGILDYAYVNDQASFYTSGLEVEHGREVLIGQGNQVIIVSVEGPDSASELLEDFWPKLLNSLRFNAAPAGGS